MAIRFESDRVWIGGVWVSKTQADIVKRQGERHALNGAPAMTPTPLADIHRELFTYDEARQLGGIVKTMILNNEDEARRRALLDLDARVAAFLQDAKVSETLDKVRGIMADMDLTHEAKQKRAIEVMQELQGRVQGYFGRIMTDLMDKLSKAERLIDGALLPEPRPGQEVLVELRAQEIRAYLASLDDAGRIGAVNKYGEKAKLEALHAMTDDPNGRDFVDRAFLDNARCAAVRAQGGEWLLDDLEDARDMLQGVATRATLVESLLWNGMGVLGVKVKQGPSQWASMAAAAVKASHEWLEIG